MVVATVALWFFARPGEERKWKLAAGSAFASAAVAIAIDQVIHAVWDRPRPYESHDISHPWAGSTDAAFPSDHSSASFAIAFAVLAFDRAVGSLFVAAATVIAIGRVFVGAHYVSDVLASVLVAAAAAFIVVRYGRPVVAWAVRLVERLTDPLWRLSRSAR
jgi:undecaprenyl-diphosphatase